MPYISIYSVLNKIIILTSAKSNGTLNALAVHCPIPQLHDQVSIVEDGPQVLYFYIDQAVLSWNGLFACSITKSTYHE